MATTNPIHITVLLLPPIQLLDASPIDLFGMLTKDYLSACRLPSPLIAGAVPLTITYASEAGAGTTADCTADAGLRVTASLHDKRVAPGKTQILLIPGPDPSAVPSETVKTFVKSHVEHGTAVLTVCTGVFVAGYAGVLDGRRATGPRALLPELRKKFPEARWEDRRWVSDGNVWCSGGCFLLLVPLAMRGVLWVVSELIWWYSWDHERARYGSCVYSQDVAGADGGGGAGNGGCGCSQRGV